MFMFLQNLQVPSTKTVISVAASTAATAVLIRSLARDYLPRELQAYVLLKIRTLFTSLSSQLTLIIDEYEGLNHNLLYQAAGVYLRPTISPNTRRFRVTMPVKETKISVSMERNEEIVDLFNGVQLKWKLVSKQIPSKWVESPGSGPYHSTLKSELRYFELCFHKKHKDMVLQTYLPYVLEKSKEVEEERKTLKLFTMRHDRVMGRRGMEGWQSVNLDHPATFETLAMDMDVKGTIMCMNGGEGETSYANNSLIQKEAMLKAKPILEESIVEVYLRSSLECKCGRFWMFIWTQHTVADLGDDRHNPCNIPRIQSKGTHVPSFP